QRRDVRASALVVGKPRVIREPGLLDRGTEPAEDRVAIRADRDPAIVAGRVDVRWSRAKQRVPSALTDGSGVTIFGQDRLEQREDGFVERHVDDLATSCDVTTMKRCERTD